LVAQVALTGEARNLRCPVGGEQQRDRGRIVRARPTEWIAVVAELAVDWSGNEPGLEQ
jgi:hypothetical protein